MRIQRGSNRLTRIDGGAQMPGRVAVHFFPATPVICIRGVVRIGPDASSRLIPLMTEIVMFLVARVQFLTLLCTKAG